MKFWTVVFFITVTIFFFLNTYVLAAECPPIGSPGATAIEFQLFTAFQVGHGGHEAPCELKCFGNERCQQRCQDLQGLRFLEEKLLELTKKNNAQKCPSYTMSCLTQCQSLGAACAEVCSGNKTIADKR